MSVMKHAHDDAWSVRWDHSGETLLSSGSDSIIKMWKRFSNFHGLQTFELYAEQSGVDDESDEVSSDAGQNTT